MKPTRSCGSACQPLLAVESLDLKEGLGDIARARAFACRAARGLSPDEATRFELAVVEAFTNVVRHAQVGPGPVHLRVEFYGDRICLSLAHAGPVFVPPHIETLNLAPDREGGMGLFLISQGADQVVYGRQTDGRAGVQLVKFLKGDE